MNLVVGNIAKTPGEIAALWGKRSGDKCIERRLARVGDLADAGRINSARHYTDTLEKRVDSRFPLPEANGDYWKNVVGHDNYFVHACVGEAKGILAYNA